MSMTTTRPSTTIEDVVAETQSMTMEQMQAVEPPLTSDHWMTVEQVCEALDIGVSGVHALTFRGRLTPKRVGRRALFRRAQVDALVQRRAQGADAKREARALREKFPAKPNVPEGMLPFTDKQWSIFTYYADSDMTLEEVGEQFHSSRQNIQQILQKVMDRLVALLNVSEPAT